MRRGVGDHSVHGIFPLFFFSLLLKLFQIVLILFEEDICLQFGEELVLDDLKEL